MKNILTRLENHPTVVNFAFKFICVNSIYVWKGLQEMVVAQGNFVSTGLIIHII